MPVRLLPPRPDLGQLKRRAEELLAARGRGDPQACQRLREFHPAMRGLDDGAITAAPMRWSDALLAIAREHGFASWRRLKAHVEGPRAEGDAPLHERIGDVAFRRAVELIDDGDAAGLAAHLAAHPGLARARVAFEGMNYFTNPGLIGFIAENPTRNESLPPNIAEVAAILLDAGAAADKAAIDEAVALVASSAVARECGVQIELIELLARHGADPEGAMQPALAHGEFEAAEALLRAGARLTLPVAAALGLAEQARGLLAEAGAEERHVALANAASHGRVEIVALLLDAGEDPDRYNPIGSHAHSTPLHQAACEGHVEVVRLLVERGARRDLKDALWQGTPLDWAEHCGKAEVAAYLRSLED